jgi:hypothetical protein
MRRSAAAEDEDKNEIRIGRGYQAVVPPPLSTVGEW